MVTVVAPMRDIKAAVWDSATRFLVLFNGIANIALGVSFLLWANASAESVLSHYFPNNLWPMLWIAAGVLGVLGLWSVLLARISFFMCGGIMFVFSLASLWAVVVEDKWVAIPTTVFLMYLTVLLFGLVRVIHQRDSILERVTAITKQGEEALSETPNSITSHE